MEEEEQRRKNLGINQIKNLRLPHEYRPSENERSAQKKREVSNESGAS